MPWLSAGPKPSVANSPANATPAAIQPHNGPIARPATNNGNGTNCTSSRADDGEAIATTNMPTERSAAATPAAIWVTMEPAVPRYGG